MDIDAAVAFVAANHHAVLATTRRDGTPQLSPVLAGVDGAGRIVISTRQTAIKTRNLRRDPRAWLCVFTSRFFGDWIQISGEADLVSLPEAMPLLEDYYRRIRGEHPDWAEYRTAMEREQRCLIRITPSRAGPDVGG